MGSETLLTRSVKIGIRYSTEHYFDHIVLLSSILYNIQSHCEQQKSAVRNKSVTMSKNFSLYLEQDTEK